MVRRHDHNLPQAAAKPVEHIEQPGECHAWRVAVTAQTGTIDILHQKQVAVVQVPHQRAQDGIVQSRLAERQRCNGQTEFSSQYADKACLARARWAGEHHAAMIRNSICCIPFG